MVQLQRWTTSSLSIVATIALAGALAGTLAGCKDDPKLKVTGLEPTVGDADGGTMVTFTGNRFTRDGIRSVKVYFGNQEVRGTSFLGDATLRVTAPGGKAGTSVDVKLFFEPGGMINIPNAFRYVDQKTVGVDDLTTK